MPVAYLYAITSVVAVSLVSFVGVIAISITGRRLQSMLFVLVSLAAGAMFGDAFIHLLPESFEKSDAKTEISMLVLAGVFLFFILEKFLRWRHEHTLEADGSVHPLGYMNLFADGLHNLIDGVLIGASYLAGVQVGVATTIAVILHEIPQEIGDFGVLLHAGFSKKRAVLFNLLSASLAIAGALIALLAGSNTAGFTDLILPVAGGAFIYIAGSDLLPELQKEIGIYKSIVQLCAMAAGAGLMMILTLLE
jgi:zinc and cadmium transporter